MKSGLFSFRFPEYATYYGMLPYVLFVMSICFLMNMRMIEVMLHL